MNVTLSLLVALAGAAPPPGAPPATCDIARQPANAPEELVAMIEIPAGGQVKYELDEASGRMQVDRFLSMPVAYPVNYGILPCTEGGDGDPLDVLILTRLPVDPGALIRVRAIGVLRMRDGGEEDDKLLVVPVAKVDPTWEEVTTVDDLPATRRAAIRAFFEVYKQLPAPGGEVELGAWEGPEAARRIVRSGLVGG